MSILVVGSVALDSIHAPSGSRDQTLGGACTYFATAASLYDRVHMVGVVGSDFPAEHLAFLEARQIDLSGLQTVEGRTFHWAGRYDQSLSDAETLETHLNVFADFHPVIPAELRGVDYVFLANIDPDLQIEVLEQMSKPRLTALDSMNYWMTSKHETLSRVISMVDVVLLNEMEVKLYAQEPNLLRAAQRIIDMGPKALVVKRGEHGAMLITAGSSVKDRYFVIPAFPLESVIDPTGAGDTFAAGFMGYLASSPTLTMGALRRAIVHGAIVASFTVEDFGLDRLRTLTFAEIEARYDAFRYLTHFAHLADPQLFQRSL